MYVSCYSFSTASNAMWAECACSNPSPRVRLDSTLDSSVRRLWSLGLSAFSPQSTLPHHGSTLGYALRGDKEFASPRAARYVSS